MASVAARAQSAAPVQPDAAPATGRTATLSYVSDPNCVSAAELTQAVHAHIGREAFVAPPSETVISVTIVWKAESQRWQALLRVGDGQQRSWGEREVFSEHADCRTLDQPLTLILALMVDSDLMQPPPAPGEEAPLPERAPEPDPKPALAEPEPVPAKRVQPPGPPWRFALEADLVLNHGALPGLALGGEIGALLVPPNLPGLRVHALVYLPQTQRVSANGEIDYFLAQAGMALCSDLFAASAWRVGGCVGIDLGALRVESQGLSPKRERTRLLPQTAVALRNELNLTPSLYVLGVGSLLFAWETDRFVYTQGNGQVAALHEVSPFLFQLGLGLGLQLP